MVPMLDILKMMSIIYSVTYFSNISPKAFNCEDHRWVRLVELGGGHKLFYFRGGLKNFDAGEIFWLIFWFWVKTQNSSMQIEILEGVRF